MCISCCLFCGVFYIFLPGLTVLCVCNRGVSETSEHGPTTSAVNIEVSTKHQVTWAPSDTEKALKTVLGFARTFAGFCHLC